MTGHRFTTPRGLAFQKRDTSFFARHRRQQSRRGQTLVEYALIVAYISVISMQAMDYLGFIAQKQYVYVNCVAIVANTNNQGIDPNLNHANEMLAVQNYLLQTSTWRNAPVAWTGPAIVEIYNKIATAVYSG